MFVNSLLRVQRRTISYFIDILSDWSRDSDLYESISPARVILTSQ